MNLPNADKAGYGETDLRCRWSSEEIGECSTKIYFKVCPATKDLKGYRIPHPKRTNGNWLRDLNRKDGKQDHWKNALYLSVNAFSRKVTSWGHYFFVSNWRRDRHFMLSFKSRQVQPLARQRKYLHFSELPWVMVRPRELNPRPPALQSEAYYRLS